MPDIMSCLPAFPSRLKLFATLAFGAMVICLVAPLRATGPQLRPDLELDPDLHPRADAAPAPVAPLRQLWAISSRSVGGGDPRDARLEYWLHDDIAGRWTAAGHEDFIAADQPGAVTCFFVHGNRINHHEALSEGQDAWRQIAACVGPAQPFRFVIWSWPSTKAEGHLKDCRYKASLSDAHAWHLAWLVDQMHPEAPVSLLGYSYGARLVSGSLHLLGGGRLASHVLTERLNPARLPLRAVLLAGALDGHALLPHGRNHKALSQVDRMLVLVNPRDPVLHHYPLLAGIFSKGPPALGYTGFFSSALGQECSKVTQWNVSSYVGKEHDWQRYLYCPAVLSRVSHWALHED